MLCYACQLIRFYRKFMQWVQKHVYFPGKGNSKLRNKKLHEKNYGTLEIFFIESDQKFRNKQQQIYSCRGPLITVESADVFLHFGNQLLIMMLLPIYIWKMAKTSPLTHWLPHQTVCDPPLISGRSLEYFRASESTKINHICSNYRHKIRFQDFVYLKLNKWTGNC